MVTSYYNYKVKIRNIEFVTEDGRKYDNTAAISFYDENKKELAYIELGYVDTSNVYKLIEDGEDVNISDCYIENFSLTVYRKSLGLAKNSTVDIKKFTAKNTIFDSRIVTDFSLANFPEGVDISGASFINGIVTFNSVNFGKGNCDFSYTFFNNGNVDFSNTEFVEGEVTFKNSVFKDGVKDFQYADFGVGDVSFINTEFNNGNVSFINTNFNKGKVTFKVARFGDGIVNFHFAKFGYEDITFERAEFGDGRVDFRMVEFGSGKVNFNRAHFGDDDVTFEAASLKKGRITFKKTFFGHGRIDFNLLEFDASTINFTKAHLGNGDISFNNSICKALILVSCHLNNYIDLRVNKCDEIDLSDTIVRDIIDFKPYDTPVDIKLLNIIGMRLLGSIYIDWIDNNVLQLIEDQPRVSRRRKAEQFRILKENYSKIGQYIQEDTAYVVFKQHEAVAELHEEIEAKPISKIWQYPVYWFKYIVFDKAGSYATNPLRVIFTMMLTFILFSLIYIVVLYTNSTGIVSGIGGEHDALSVVGRSFYHSAITFLTIGYGDFYPFGSIRWLSGIEGFIGLFLMSYFTVAFVRKVLR